jgi:hypothetical protein
MQVSNKTEGGQRGNSVERKGQMKASWVIIQFSNKTERGQSGNGTGRKGADQGFMVV